MKINWISRQNIVNFYLDEINKGKDIPLQIKQMISKLTK